ncbi:12196_t:CDS:2 [Funneliformis geosporum]|uniref:12196_t:CDS:1 n=1 Tax=Funneliformis geosporum TaxID=1117311 RepID=A0A9W4WRI7_9GLOM|nr:12196_t:CDS:2 [Funneliformis geosporum]
MNDFKQLLETKEGYDVIFYIGEEPIARKFYAHSLILGCRSQYFSILFSNVIEKVDGCYNIKKPNIPSEIFHHILSGEEILNIIVAASEFYLQNLVEHLKEYLCTNRREILQSNPLELLVLSFQHESLFSLQEMIIKLICQKPKVIFNTRYFYCLPPNVLETLIKREDLILDEIIIWENLVKWCIYQCKYFENEKDIYKINLSDEEFNNIKETLENYIYLINFQEISARDFLNKVMPYEELLPRELKKDILRYHMLPGIESPDNSSPVNTPEPSQSPTPSLRAIRCFKGWGPIFGNLNGDSNDLAMTSLGNWSSSSGSYENVGIPNHFKVEEWEVFQIKKKKEYELLARAYYFPGMEIMLNDYLLS